jgi:hypothetical protein
MMLLGAGSAVQAVAALPEIPVPDPAEVVANVPDEAFFPAQLDVFEEFDASSLGALEELEPLPAAMILEPPSSLDPRPLEIYALTVSWNC